jgi:DNA-binding NarL/FixJ family response regulator
MTRMGLKLMIAGEPDLEVCGEVGNAGEALDAAIRLHPALVLTDISLPGRSGFELVQDLHARCPDIPVLILSMHAETSYARRALEIGARGYIMKSERSEKVLEAIHTVMKGRIYVSEAIAGQLLEFLSHQVQKQAIRTRLTEPQGVRGLQAHRRGCGHAEYRKTPEPEPQDRRNASGPHQRKAPRHLRTAPHRHGS